MFNELVDDISFGVQERYHVVDVAFPNRRHSRGVMIFQVA